MSNDPKTTPVDWSKAGFGDMRTVYAFNSFGKTVGEQRICYYSDLQALHRRQG